ncbi:TetR/AcrR family transcriptional regulator [Romboutsia maritimum]|uniref:TetR/AcrR family transcriptional regulator n=1 Tax=Romboutsia maritimum TaxID=2020948 RepID=A0A371ITY1_9FIRM|nr:TetR/AcrR family transcriptional regulator [Romboutsia maritimum]RDY23919.1 TetR/AcrR family transcriptional regulator [Romboutsia maritimum]
MYEKFTNLNNEKQITILNCAIKEFAQNGYHKASTDKIASSSNIAKGSLFHYFKNKKNLYLYTVKHCMNFISAKVKDKASNIESSIFYERMKFISIYKQNVFITYPLYTKICLDAFSNSDEEIKEELQVLINKYYTDSMTFMEDYVVKYLDKEYLRKDIDIKDVLFMTTTVFEALSKKYISLYKSESNIENICINVIFKEFDKYIDILKYGLYKNN